MADLTLTPANVFSSTGAFQIGTLAETVTQGQPLYLTTSNTLGLADADGTSPAGIFAGISLTAGATGQKVLYIAQDAAFAHGLSGVVSGDTLYLSDNPGRITKTIGDLESGDIITVLGVATSATTMNLKPVRGGAI